MRLIHAFLLFECASSSCEWHVAEVVLGGYEVQDGEAIESVAYSHCASFLRLVITEGGGDKGAYAGDIDWNQTMLGSDDGYGLNIA